MVDRPKLHGILVFAPDLATARRFYADVLGFGVASESDSHVELEAADFRLTLFRCDRSTSPAGYSAQAGSSLSLSVLDLDAEVERLRGAGVTILHDEPVSGPIGRYVAFVDPFGTVHELLEASGSSTSRS